ncbi:hypothetical protein ACHAXN_003837 [Cyclotella atomus]
MKLFLLLPLTTCAQIIGTPSPTPGNVEKTLQPTIAVTRVPSPIPSTTTLPPSDDNVDDIVITLQPTMDPAGVETLAPTEAAPSGFTPLPSTPSPTDTDDIVTSAPSKKPINKLTKRPSIKPTPRPVVDDDATDDGYYNYANKDDDYSKKQYNHQETYHYDTKSSKSDNYNDDDYTKHNKSGKKDQANGDKSGKSSSKSGKGSAFYKSKSGKSNESKSGKSSNKQNGKSGKGNGGSHVGGWNRYLR